MTRDMKSRLVAAGQMEPRTSGCGDSGKWFGRLTRASRWQRRRNPEGVDSRSGSIEGPKEGSWWSISKRAVERTSNQPGTDGALTTRACISKVAVILKKAAVDIGSKILGKETSGRDR